MRRPIAVAVVVAALAVAAPVTASAGDTSVSFTVNAAAGGLSISQASGSAALSSATFNASGASTVTGNLPDTTVTDQRGSLAAAWTVSVSGTDFVHASTPSQVVGKANARVYLDAANLAGLTTMLGANLAGMTVTSFESNVGTSNLATSYTLVAGTTTLGDGSVTYTPRMDVNVPAGTPAGTYGATVTQTVS